MNPTRIRVLAIGIFRRGDTILVGEGFDPVKGDHFYRPLGGGVEFGEHSRDALRREMREEINAEICAEQLLGTIENRFVFNGKPGHELVQVYAAQFVDATIYARTNFIVTEDGTEGRAVWKPMADFRSGQARLVPEELLGLLERDAAR